MLARLPTALKPSFELADGGVHDSGGLKDGSTVPDVAFGAEQPADAAALSSTPVLGDESTQENKKGPPRSGSGSSTSDALTKRARIPVSAAYVVATVFSIWQFS